MFGRGICTLPLFVCIAGICALPVKAQEPARSTASTAAPPADPLAGVKTDKGLISLTKAAPDVTPVSDYTGNFWNRSTAFGALLGRQKLYEKGITIDVQFTQVYQGIASGGPENGPSARYTGLLDYGMTFDTAKLGLWSRGLIVLNAQTSMGHSLLGSTGNISPVNYLSLWPEAGKASTFLMDYYLTQALPHNTVLMLGRLNAVEVLDRNRFANNPRDQFLNLTMDNDPLMGAFVSMSTYGVLTHTTVSKYFGLNLAFADASTKPGDWTGNDTGGFFHRKLAAVDMQGSWKAGGDRDGEVEFTWIWATGTPIDFGNPRLPIYLLTGRPLPRRNNNNFLGANIQQYLWKPAGASRTPASTSGPSTSGPRKFTDLRTAEYDYQERGLGFFFRGGWTPADRNPYNVDLSGGVGGRGILSSRPYDRFGVGAYWLKESKDLNRALFGLLLGDETGFEGFYNVAITPWMNVSGTLQWISSGIRATHNPLVLGLRLNVRL